MKPVLTDLRSITRDYKRCCAVVTIEMDWQTKIKWLVLGQVQLRTQRDSRLDGCFRLEAYLKEGVTDFEHDSAYALRLPLIGVVFDRLVVHYHTLHLIAWVDPNTDDQGFHIPLPGYNPMKHKQAQVCKDKRCRTQYLDEHIMVPEGFYVPPFDRELYEAVRGKKLEIRIGPTHQVED